MFTFGRNHVIVLYDKINWIIKITAKIIKIIEIIFFNITIVSRKLLLSCIPPHLLLHPCHFPRGTSVKYNT
jgi:hypothetical protein